MFPVIHFERIEELHAGITKRANGLGECAQRLWRGQGDRSVVAGIGAVGETLQHQLVHHGGEVDVIEHMNRLQAFFRAGRFECAHADSHTGYLVQGNAGVGNAHIAVARRGDAVVAKFGEEEVIDLAIQREAGSTHADTRTVHIEGALRRQIGWYQLGWNIAACSVWITAVILILRLDEAP